MHHRHTIYGVIMYYSISDIEPIHVCIYELHLQHVSETETDK